MAHLTSPVVYLDPKTGVALTLVQWSGQGPGRGRFVNWTIWSYSVSAPETHVRYDCGCHWTIDPLGSARPVGSIRDLPPECPEHCACMLAEGGFAHDWWAAYPVGRAPYDVCQRCGYERRQVGSPTGSPTVTLAGAALPVTSVSVNLATGETTESTPESELELAFETEPITGWRAWRVVDFHRHGGIVEKRLQSLTGRDTLEPLIRAEGRCIPRDPYYGTASHHEAPWPSCHCGIWATRTRELLPLHDFRSEDPRALVCVGEVALWGRVLEFEKGWRARYAYPTRLILLGGEEETRAALARSYGVAVEREGPESIIDEAAALEWATSLRAMNKAATSAFEQAMVAAIPTAKAIEEILTSMGWPSTLAPIEPPPLPQRRTLPPPRPRPTSRETFKREKNLGP